MMARIAKIKFLSNEAGANQLMGAIIRENINEAISILNATSKDLTAPIREGGGIGEWIFKGTKGNSVAEINATIHCPDQFIPIRYRISFTQVGQRFELVDESVESERPTSSDQKDVYFFYRYQHGKPVLNVRIPDPSKTESDRKFRTLQRKDLDIDQSVPSFLLIQSF